MWFIDLLTCVCFLVGLPLCFGDTERKDPLSERTRNIGAFLLFLSFIGLLFWISTK